MPRWGLWFVGVALLSGVAGFVALQGVPAGAAKVLAVACAAVAAVAAVMGRGVPDAWRRP